MRTEMTGNDALPKDERIRRFWTAHGRSQGHLAVLHAMCVQPGFSWTPEHLLIWYGIDLGRAQSILRELDRCGIARQVDGTRTYRWQPRLDWVSDGGATGWRQFRDRWTELERVQGEQRTTIGA